MTPKFVIERSADKQIKFVLKAPNNEVILTSELYHLRANAYKGIESVVKNCNNLQFEHRQAADDQFYFVQKATNGEIIGTSEMYKTAQARASGIEAVITYAPFAEIIDRT